MAPADVPPPDHSLDAHDQLQHDLKAPLTIVYGRAQLLARAIRRSPALSAAERAGMLAGLGTIEAAVLALVATIDTMGHEGRDTAGNTDPD
jgi:signal transduction histidine kinase